MKIQAFDFSINVMKALLWRHNNAVNLQALLQDKQDALDELNQDFWESWIEDVFNLQTANDFGLSVWAIILNIQLTIDNTAPETTDNSNFGFGPLRKNFNNGNFTSFGDQSILTTEDARIVLKLRYYQLITRGTIPECNKIVADVFTDKTVYALDGLDMTISYVFSEYPSSALRLALNKFDLLPRPSAVQVKTVFQANGFFGFGSFRKNFNNGNFRSQQ